MTIGDLLVAVETERSTGRRFNTIVCRPQHLERWTRLDPDALRCVFAEHDLRLHVDPASPWEQVSVLWIDRPIEVLAA